MTAAPRATQARNVLDWCRLGHAELRREPVDEWIVVWAGTLGLLRTVGDALENDSDPRIRKAQERWWERMADDNKRHRRGEHLDSRGRTRWNQDTWEPAIFWQFIRKDRNLLLHEAVLTAGMEETRSFHMHAATHPAPPPPSPMLIRRAYPVEVGPFAGQDQRAVVRDAIEWWERQIDGIEQDAT